MFHTRIAVRLAGIIGAAVIVAASPALAHETDLHHWYEHQRAMTDGGTVGITERGEPLGDGNGGALRGWPRVTSGWTQSSRDCFVEQLRVTDGHVRAECPGLEESRWVVDEDKQQRRAERAR
jgi:hypothetical protein